MTVPAVRGDDHLEIYRDRLLSRRGSARVPGVGPPPVAHPGS
ncbi:hypothetical protein SUDANB38_00149 [Streptomyces sp. enrichment culture]